MRYVQIKRGQKSHLVIETRRDKDDTQMIKSGLCIAPICGRRFDRNDNYKVANNIPLGNICKNCLKVYRSRGMVYYDYEEMKK